MSLLVNKVFDIAVQNLEHANYAKNQFKEMVLGLMVLHSMNLLSEFDQPIKDINKKLAEHGFIGGFDLGGLSRFRKSYVNCCY